MSKKPLFNVIYEDDSLAAADKAAGLSVGGDRWDAGKERLDRLLQAERGYGRLFTVHRIDRDTSGLVVFAKTKDAHRELSLLFEGREVKKRYRAVVLGRPPWKEADCDLPLVPDGNKRHLTIVDKYRGKRSLTRFSLRGSAGNYSVLDAFPETGRTHQIRVHLAALGYPVCCDPLYGDGRPVFLSNFKPNRRGDPFDERPLLARLGLHAAALAIPLPGRERLELEAPLPRDLSALINQMNKWGA